VATNRSLVVVEIANLKDVSREARLNSESGFH